MDTDIELMNEADLRAELYSLRRELTSTRRVLASTRDVLKKAYRDTKRLDWLLKHRNVWQGTKLLQTRSQIDQEQEKSPR